jgi:hypothetical protein
VAAGAKRSAGRGASEVDVAASGSSCALLATSQSEPLARRRIRRRYALTKWPDELKALLCSESSWPEPALDPSASTWTDQCTFRKGYSVR